MNIINSSEKKIVSGSIITFIRYKLVSEIIDGSMFYGIILSQRVLDGDDVVLTAPNFTNDFDKASNIFKLLVDGIATAETFYDIFDDFFVC